MPDIAILTESDLRQAVKLDLEAVKCVERAFVALASGKVVMPPIMSMQIAEHHGEVDVKTAYMPGLDTFAIKMSPGFFDNPKIGLPSVNGLMVQFSATTGLVQAVLLDNGYLTDVRTAAAGAVAAKWLSRPEARIAGIIGTGTQARLQLEALTLVRPIRKAAIWGRDPDKAARMAEDSRSTLGIEVAVAPGIEELAHESDIIVTTTPSTEPLIEASDLRPGQHVTAMGSDADYKCELHPSAIARADLYACDNLAQCLAQGELRAAVAAGAVTADLPHRELGDVIASGIPGRTDAADITICDLTGTGIQDTAIADLASRRARLAGAGTQFNSD
jgi:ornithine cyclodeaminase